MKKSSNKKKKIIILIVTIVLSVSLLILLINRKALFGLPDNSDIIIFNILSGIIGIACIFAAVISAVRLFGYIEKTPKKKKTYGVTVFSFNEIIKIVEKSDIVEIVAGSDDTTVTFGTASESKADSKLYNKQFYINNTFYSEITDFKNELKKYCKNEEFQVVCIDDADPKYYKIGDNK